MDIWTARVVTPARIVALTFIAVAVLGLAYLRLAPGSQPVSVPAGAKAGQLTLTPCTYTSENRSYAADCGTLVVPENRAVAGSRLLALPVTRIHARSGHRGDPIFYLEGGPGLSNAAFEQAGRFAADRDVVLVGYRGVDSSVRLDCPEVESALKHSTDVLSDASLRAYGHALHACAARLTKEGVDLAGYGLPQQVDDLEAARVALGYPRLDLLSQSAGTRTAMIYAWRYPASIHRSVMIGVNPPGGFLFDSAMTDEVIARYAERCADDTVCRARTDDLAAMMRRATVHIPDRWLFLPIKRGSALVATSFALPDSTPTAGLSSAPAAFDAWLAASQGDPSGLWLLALLGDVVVPHVFVWGEYADAGTLDAQAARLYFAPGAQDPGSVGYAGSAFAWGGGRMADAWPAAPDENLYRQVRTSNVETLLISGELDAATPAEAAVKQLLPYLPNGHQVVLPNIGHIPSFFAEQPEAGSHLINTFFASGRVDRSLYQPQKVDFTPGMSAPETAKKVLGLLAGAAGVTVLSLLWMAFRVRSRGRLGRITRVLVRSIGALLLGLGGWFLGLLVVLAAMPGVSLDNQLLAVLGAGVPVGLAVALAWVDRDWPTGTKVTGFAAAATGALIGAWLGFHAVGGLLVLVTPVIGSVVGANLVLIALDITRDRRAGLVPPVPRQRRRRKHEAPLGESGTIAGHAAT